MGKRARRKKANLAAAAAEAPVEYDWRKMLPEIKIQGGGHQGVTNKPYSVASQACVMEWVHIFSGAAQAMGTVSDAPECACPFLRQFAVWINDVLSDLPGAVDLRTKLLAPLIPLLLDSRTNDVEVRAERSRVMQAAKVKIDSCRFTLETATEYVNKLLDACLIGQPEKMALYNEAKAILAGETELPEMPKQDLNWLKEQAKEPVQATEAQKTTA